jgi:ribosomal protein S18 acetylase RimI-like enzyme
MSIRPATPADTPFLRQLHHRAYRDVVVRQFGSWDEAAQDGWFEKGLAEADFGVVEEQGQAIGTVGLKDFPDRVELVELQLLPEWQGRGLGTALLRAELERAQRLDKPVRLRVLLENRARSLYERHGFAIVGQTDTHYLMEWKPSR